ncbi:MAG: hypothetical protein AcusKO_27650 [Acuticoccus sp.]
MSHHYIWDEAKRRSNLAKHSLDFSQARRIAWDYAILIQLQTVDGEERELVYAALEDRIVVVVYTMRGDAMRLISLRYATGRERITYYENTR